MSPMISNILFAAAAIVIVVAQGMILRSTRRGMRHGPRDTASLLEWMYAILPAVALVIVLAWTWRTMHPVAGSTGSPPAAPGTFS